jgi:hypothetical protein
MPLSDDWRKTFPYEDTRQVVSFVKETWCDLVARKVPRFDPSSHEPKLTHFLSRVLDMRASDEGLTGCFVSEGHEGKPNLETGELENKGRTDIRYFSDRTEIDLTFEFKKLKNRRDSRLAYYGTEGMQRFLNGKYSSDKHLGLMVGLISENVDACINGLKLSISRHHHSGGNLHMSPDADGTYIHEPSRELPGLVQFDTEHSRATYSNKVPIVLCHLFLFYGDAV